jgi:hypothetical protein
MTNLAFANTDEIILNWNADKADLSQRNRETNEDIRRKDVVRPFTLKETEEQAYIQNLLRVPILSGGLREASNQIEEQHISKPRSSTWPCEQTSLGLQQFLESGFSATTNDLAFNFHYQDKDQGSFQSSSQTPYLAQAYSTIEKWSAPLPIPPYNHSRRASLPGIAMPHPIPPRDEHRRASLLCTGSSLVASSQRNDSLSAVDYCQATSQPKSRIRRDSFPSSFPSRLHSILSGPESQEYIAWLPHGRAFRVLKQKGIEDNVLSRFFKSRRYESFQRQVCQYGIAECSRC